MQKKPPSNTKIFKDRAQAGHELAEAIDIVGQDVLVLALPRGGVPVGYEIAKALAAPLDVVVARKIGMPQNKEFAIGAIAEGGVRVFDERTIDATGLSTVALSRLLAEEELELSRRVSVYRNNRELPPLSETTVILVDDGLATGFTAKAAIKSIRLHTPKRLVFAVPVCANDAFKEIAPMVDEFICLLSPWKLGAVGAWYRQFDQTTDDEVLRLLANTEKQRPRI